MAQDSKQIEPYKDLFTPMRYEQIYELFRRTLNPPQRVSANTTLSASYNIIEVDATSGARTILLPPAVQHKGRIYSIKKIDSSANAVTVDGNLTETIDGALTWVLNSQYSCIMIVSNGTGWDILNRTEVSSLTPGTFPAGDYIFPNASSLTIIKTAANGLILKDTASALGAPKIEWQNNSGTQQARVYGTSGGLQLAGASGNPILLMSSTEFRTSAGSLALGSTSFPFTGLWSAGATLTGHVTFTDNTYDIGASGATRPRTGYFGTEVRAPTVRGTTIVVVNTDSSGVGDLRLGGTAGSQYGMANAQTINAASGFAVGAYWSPTLVAQANNDALRAWQISSTYTANGKTGLTYTGILIGNVTGGATNWSLYCGLGDINFTGNVLWATDNTYDLGAAGATRPRDLYLGRDIYTNNATFFHRSKATLTNSAGAGAGTITNAPAAGNPTKWIAIDDNGTTRQIPAW